MIVNELGICNDDAVKYDNLLSYLSNELFLIQNDRVRTSFVNFKECEMEYNSIKKQIRHTKGLYTKEHKEFNKQRVLFRVVNQIKTLKKEGVLDVDDNKTKILGLLSNLNSLSMTDLTSIEEDLSVYTEKPNINEV